MSHDDSETGRGRSEQRRTDESAPIRIGRRSYLRLTAATGALLGAGLSVSTGGGGWLVQPAQAYAGDGTPVLRATEQVAVTTSETEPNDDRQTATQIRVNEGVGGSLTEDEHDWFGADVVGGTELTVAFERTSGTGTAAVAVYGPSGDFLDMLVEGSGSEELTVTPETSGTLFAQVIDLDQGTGSYTLLVRDGEYRPPTPTPTSTPTPEPCDESTTFVPNAAGRIVVEAEHFAVQHATDERRWYRVSEDSEPGVSPDPDGSHASTASNGEYIEVLPDTRVTHDDPLVHGVNFDDYPTDGDPMAVVDYPVEFDSAGRYYVWVRGLRTGSEDNGVHVGVDGTWDRSGARIQWCTPRGEWHWRSRLRTAANHCGDPDARAYVEVDAAGSHTVQFAMREDGFEMDKFVLTPDESFEPSGLGEAETVKSDCRTSTPTPAPAPSEHVWIEAESARSGENFAPFEARSDVAAAGGEYIVTPDEGRNNYGGPPADGHAVYAFDVPTDGEHVLWGRTKGLSGGNSFYVGVDGVADTEWHVDAADEWRWSRLPVTPTLPAGSHELTVAYREDGTALDKLLVTTDADYEPSGTGGALPTTPTPPTTSDEGVWIEAETAADGADFAPITVRSDATASGGAYVEVPNGTGNHYGSAPDTGRAVYSFDVPVDGEYAVWGRCIAPTGDDNSFWVSVDGGRDHEWWVARESDGGQGEWGWFRVNDRSTDTYPVTFDLPAGEHELAVTWREDGTKLDRLFVTSDLDAVPSGEGGGVGETPTPTPAPTPTPDPGQSAFVDHDVSRIEAEAYDEGGEGIAYADTDGTNDGGAYRTDGVDVQSTGDDDGYNVGWIRDGEWLEYTIDLPAGTYDFRARLASINDGTRLRATLDGTTLGTFDVPNTGDWQRWETVTLTGLETTGGSVLRLEAVGNGFNVNWVGFTEADEPTPTPTATPAPTPVPTPAPVPGEATVTGELKKWHRMTLSFEGPETAERSDPNPFLQYRLDVTLEGPSGQQYLVPGFYATDGDGGESGGVWKARFAPDEAGTWRYGASFREGSNVAVSLDPAAGRPTAFDGASGTFEIEPTDKAGRDFRARGTLTNRGSHYLQFPDGVRWLKCGPDIPENFLGYDGFTNQPDAGHDFSAHRSGWESGDPDWDGGAGKGIVGAINYLASTGANCLYFLPMNVGGDGRDTWPFVERFAKTRYDTDKLRQWETVFTHAQSKGVFLHFQLAETESGNENYFDGGDLGVERKLFYRELVARFGHHPGLQWNLGEENDYGTTKRERFAAYIHDVDPYDHPVTTHTHSGRDETYDPLLGNDDFDMAGFQGGWSRDKLASLVQEWRRKSADAGVPWVVSLDEPQRIEKDATDDQRGLPHGRVDKMWPLFMSGGGGFEWYVQQDGGGHSLDQEIDDLREIGPALEWSGHLLRFFDQLDYWRMEADHGAVSDGDGYMLADSGVTYAVYLPDGDQVSVATAGGTYSLTWFDPETGEEYDGGSLTGGSQTSLGRPPFGGDAAAILRS